MILILIRSERFLGIRKYSKRGRREYQENIFLNNIRKLYEMYDSKNSNDKIVGFTKDVQLVLRLTQTFDRHLTRAIHF